MTADLSIDTGVRRLDAPGLWAADLSDDWSYLAPSGGVLMTTALRAMGAEIDDASYEPLSATALFCTPVIAGPIRIQVEVIRRGKAAVQVRSELRREGAAEPGLEVSATFVRERHGQSFPTLKEHAVRHVDAKEIDLPARHPERQITFFRNFDTRLATPPPWWEHGGSASDRRVARWMRYKVPQRGPSGALDPLAIPPIADTMPPSVAQRLGPGSKRFYAPSLDLTVHFLEPTTSEWLLVDTLARHARAGWASAEAEIRDDEGRLVAYATQTMILRERS